MKSRHKKRVKCCTTSPKFENLPDIKKKGSFHLLIYSTLIKKTSSFFIWPCAAPHITDGTNHREIIESAKFERERAAIEPDARQFDDAFNAIQWALAIKPECGQKTENPTIWAIRAEGWNLTPIIVYYEFDHRAVTLVSIQTAEAPTDEVDSTN